MGHVTDIEKARAGALAELEYRNAHAEIFKDTELTEDEKNALSVLGNKVSEKAMAETEEEIPKKEIEQSKEAKENQEKILVEKIITLIEQNPDLDFVVSANGNFLDKEHGTDGQGDYIFNKETQKMDYLDNSKKDYQGLDDVLTDIKASTPSPKDLKLFSPYWSIHQEWKTVRQGSENKRFLLPRARVSVRFPFNARTQNNTFSTEHRLGTHLSFALQYPMNKPEFFSSLDDKNIKTFLENPNTVDGRKLLGDVFMKAAQKWFPEYWNFFLKEMDLYKKAQGTKN